MDLVNPPQSGDDLRAEEMLDEIAKVLQKYKALLIHKPDCMVLAVAQPRSSTWRAIAQVAVISCLEIRWRPVQWNPATNERVIPTQ